MYLLIQTLILQLSDGIWEPYTPTTVTDPKDPMQWEWPGGDYLSDTAWAKLTRPIKEAQPAFQAFLKETKSKKKTKTSRKKTKIHNKQTSRNQLNRVLGILDQLRNYLGF